MRTYDPWTGLSEIIPDTHEGWCKLYNNYFQRTPKDYLKIKIWVWSMMMRDPERIMMFNATPYDELTAYQHGTIVIPESKYFKDVTGSEIQILLENEIEELGGNISRTS